MTAETSSVPIVDFAGWSTNASNEQRKEVANQLVEACRTVGFVYIINHNVTPKTLAEAFGWSKKLFDLEREQKMLAPHPDGYTVHRGYSWPGLEKVSNAMGDEEDEDLTEKLRQVSDVKVMWCLKAFDVLFTACRKATRSAVKAIRISQISGCQNMSFPVSAAS